MLTERRGHSDLHHHRWCWINAAVDIGHEAGGETTGQLLTWCGEGRLGDGVVLHLEVEHDHVADSCSNGAGCVHKTCRATNSDLYMSV